MANGFMKQKQFREIIITRYCLPTHLSIAINYTSFENVGQIGNYIIIQLFSFMV